MVEWKNGKLFVDFHEWAWSSRTCGYGVYAVKSTGEIEKIGTTTKKPMTYTLPEGTVAVFRYYESNRGYATIYIYLPDGRTFAIDEKDNFKMPEELSDTIKKAIIDWLNL